MNYEDTKKFEIVCDAEGWSAEEYEPGSWILENYSPLGENLILNLDGGTIAELAEDAKRATLGFDAVEHAAGWYQDRREQWRGLRALLDDADEIDEMQRSLAEALCRAAGVDYGEIVFPTYATPGAEKAARRREAEARALAAAGETAAAAIVA